MKRLFLEPFHPVSNPIGIIAPKSAYDSSRYHEAQKKAVSTYRELEAAGVSQENIMAKLREIPRSIPINSPSALPEGVPEQSSENSIFITRSANEWLNEAAAAPDPGNLWYEFWNEGELCCLFADSNAGKSILAVQIAAEVARTHRTLYFDFEMSSKQFQRRYTDAGGNLHHFPENFTRIELNPSTLRKIDDIEELLMAQILRLILNSEAQVVIIDNLGFLCTQSEQGDAAGRLMRQLKEIQNRTKASILIIGHTPKRDLSTPITQNELAGSKRLFNFFDSVFAIGQSARDQALRYLKQIKVRASEYTYTAENVLTCEIVKEGAFLRFAARSKEPEATHLRKPDEQAMLLLTDRMLQLHNQGMTIKEIARELNVSYSKVQRTLKRTTA